MNVRTLCVLMIGAITKRCVMDFFNFVGIRCLSDGKVKGCDRVADE